MKKRRRLMRVETNLNPELAIWWQEQRSKALIKPMKPVLSAGESLRKTIKPKKEITKQISDVRKEARAHYGSA